MMESLHLIRPLWLLALIPLLFISWRLWHRQRRGGNWQRVIDPMLLPHVLIGNPGKSSQWPVVLFTLAGLLSILALSGPAWKQLPQPVFKQQSALVLVLDLSRSMDSTDIKPSRLTRARHKISDILKRRKEGQTALVVYAAGAFTVSPLTDDTRTIENMMNSLDTGIMPAQGSDLGLGLKKAMQLMKNASIHKGDILLITDGIESTSTSFFERVKSEGYRISILAAGTEQGAPIPNQGGFIKDNHGRIVVPRLEPEKLQQAARAGGGRFATIQANDDDIQYLLAGLNIDKLDANSEATELKTDVWQEEGPWLLLLVLPIAALAFRRGYLALVILIILPLPEPAMALSWDDLWKNTDQQAYELLQQNQPEQAADKFNDPQWKAAAQYRAKQYQQALEQLDGINTADAHYNRGNSFTQLGQLDEASKAYDQALKLDPNHEDARFNKNLVEQMKQQQQQNQESQSGDQNSQKQEQDQDQEQNQQQNSSENQQSSDSQSSSQQDGQSENSDSQAQNSDENTDKNDSEQQSSQSSSDKETEQQQQTEAEETGEPDDKDSQATNAADSQPDLSEQARQQWLRQIPDEPGNLLQRKFQYQYRQQKPQRDTGEAW